jgi:hypothetical protein
MVRPPTTVTTNLPGHQSPPQPHQEPSLDYFQGAWTFSWVGRESPLGAGPRNGTVTFAPAQGGKALTMSTEGQFEDGSALKETGTVEWEPSTKTLTFRETLANGVRLITKGDWSSPIAIMSESQPVRAGSEDVRLRRRINVTSANAFSVVDEISSAGGPYIRLGTGTFHKQ